MIKVYDEDDNIVSDSYHNAEMISAYLHNVAIDCKDILSDSEFNLLLAADELLWKLKDGMADD